MTPQIIFSYQTEVWVMIRPCENIQVPSFDPLQSSTDGLFKGCILFKGEPPS